MAKTRIANQKTVPVPHNMPGFQPPFRDKMREEKIRHKHHQMVWPRRRGKKSPIVSQLRDCQEEAECKCEFQRCGRGEDDEYHHTKAGQQTSLFVDQKAH